MCCHSLQVVLDERDDVSILAMLASIGQRSIAHNHYAFRLDVCSYNQRTVVLFHLVNEQVEAVEVTQRGVRQSVLK